MISEHQRRIEQSRASLKANRVLKAKAICEKGAVKIYKFIERTK